MPEPKDKKPLANNELHLYDPMTTWDPANAAKKLNQLYQSVLQIADSKITWYRAYRSKKGYWAKRIRLLAVLLLVLSTLMPYIASVNPGDGDSGNKTGMTILYIGYILAAVGGGLMILDRYYGFSTSWVRFVLTGMDLEAMRNTFVEQWQILYLKSIPLQKDTFCFMVETITKFRESFKSAVKTETETWAREFQQNFNELISTLKNQSDKLQTAMEKKQEEANFRRQNDEYEVTDIGEIPEEIFEQAKNEKWEKWKKDYNLIAVGHGRKITDGDPLGKYCIILYPQEKLEEGQTDFIPIPATLTYKTGGTKYELPTDVIPMKGRMTLMADPALLCDSFALKRPGCSVSRHGQYDSSGTIGLKVYRENKEYILSCYHVFCNPELKTGIKKFEPDSSIGSVALVSPSREDEEGKEKVLLGKVTDGELNDILDGAIANIDSDRISFADKVCNIGRKPGEALKIIEKHARESLAVVSVGRTSGEIRGTITAHSINVDVDFTSNGSNEVHKLHNVILSNQRSKPGDSGAVVLDAKNNVIGIISASSGDQTCIIPITRLLERFSITLKPGTS